MIELDRVTKRFGALEAVSDAALAVTRGEFLAVLGPSGCGKTTMLRLIAGFEEPDAGTVCVDGRAGHAATVRGSRPSAARSAWSSRTTRCSRTSRWPTTSATGCRAATARPAWPRCSTWSGSAGLEQRRPHELSGGQQQRVALARALAPQPSTVLLDEPWSNIDPLLRGAMRDEIARILRAAGVTVVLVTHDQEEAFSLADRIALMDDGRIVQVGTPEEMYYRPASPPGRRVRRRHQLRRRRQPARRPRRRAGTAPATCWCGPSSSASRSTRTAARAPVVGREFRGHDVFYRVDLGDGSSICSQRPSNEVVPLGARVRVALYDGPVKVFS